MITLNAIFDSVDRLNDRLGKVLSFGVLFIFLLVLTEVIGRYCFNRPSTWRTELTQMIFGVYVVLSGGPIFRWGGHVNVDIIYAGFSPKTKAIADIITFFIFFIFCGMMVYYGGILAWESLALFEHTDSAWNPPIYPVKLTIPIGAFLLLAQGIVKLRRDILTLISAKNAESRDTAKEKTK